MKAYTEKNRGLTFIELAITIAVVGLMGLFIFNFFRDTFSIWWTTRDTVQTHGDSRTAVNEMSRYVRQASSGTISVGGGNDAVTFRLNKSTDDWGSSDLWVKYYLTGGALKRVMKGSTSTVIPDGVNSLYIWHSSGTPSSYAYVGASLTVTSEDVTAHMDKRIMLRNR